MYYSGTSRTRTVLTPYLSDIFPLDYSGFACWHGGQLANLEITFVNERRWILPGTINIVSRTSILPATIYKLYCILNAVQNLVKLMSNQYVVNTKNTKFFWICTKQNPVGNLCKDLFHSNMSVRSTTNINSGSSSPDSPHGILKSPASWQRCQRRQRRQRELGAGDEGSDDVRGIIPSWRLWKSALGPVLHLLRAILGTQGLASWGSYITWRNQVM